MMGRAQDCQSTIEHRFLSNKSVVYSSSVSSAAPEMVMVRSCVLLSKASSSVMIVLGVKGQQDKIKIYLPVDTSERCKSDDPITLYLMRTVFFLDVLVPWSSNPEIFESDL